MSSSIRPEHSKFVWDLLILKILASHPDGEAQTSEITRALIVLDSNARETLPSHEVKNGIFGSGFVISPHKGLWRITDEGRNYLKDSVPNGVQAVRTVQQPEQNEQIDIVEDPNDETG